MQKQPTISVIIPNYNNAQFLTECVDSVFVQTYQPLECIVVDDGSTDNSLEVLNELSQKYPKLRIFEQINSGPSVARNLGMKHAKGEYIAVLDADDYWSPCKLENQVKLVESEKDVISSHCNFSRSTGEFFPLNKYSLPPYTPFDLLERNSIIGSCSSILFAKSILKTVGEYNSTLRVSEDQEFHFRMALAGCYFKHVNSCDVHIRWHSNNTTKNCLKVVHFNLMAFELQLQSIRENHPNLLDDKKAFNKAIIGRIGTIHYWAKQANNKPMISYLNHLLSELIGWKKYKVHKFNVLLHKALKAQLI